MSFPILRADLNIPDSSKLQINSLSIPGSSTFIEKRILALSKNIVSAAVSGKKNHTVTIVIKANVEPVSAGLKANFPDATFTFNGGPNADELSDRDDYSRRETAITISWEIDEVTQSS